MKPKLKNVFLAGLAVTIPVGLTIYILIFLIDLMDGLLRVMPAGLHPDQLLGVRIPGLGVIATLILIFVAGLLATSYRAGSSSVWPSRSSTAFRWSAGSTRPSNRLSRPW